MINKELQQNKVLLKTYGCQMNEYDSEIVRSILQGEGYAFTDKEEEADVVLLNTCSVRENAHRKVFGHIHEIHHRRKDNPVIMGILGCMATGLKEDLLNNKSLKIDFIAGPDSYKRLPELFEEVIKTKDRRLKNQNKKSLTTDHWPLFADFSLSESETYSDVVPERKEGVNAWITIMRGCNNFCSFCIVPYTRGRERSRSPESILKEAQNLANQGYKQVTLLGQNVNSYHHGDTDFPALIEKVSEIEGLKRIRFIAPHPKDFPQRLIQLIATNPKICGHIHLPLQSGNDRVLKAMNRPYTKKEFIDLALSLREQIPDVAITTDIIVGFPTETDDEFMDTVDVFKQVEFDSAFIFKYSPRKGTRAAEKFSDDVPEEKKTERIVLLNKLQKTISLKKNEGAVNQVIEVMVERQGGSPLRKNTVARTDTNKLVVLPPAALNAGDLLKVKITQATPHALKGRYLSEADS